MQALMKRETWYIDKGSLFQEKIKILNVYTQFASKYIKQKLIDLQENIQIRVGDFQH